MMQKAWCSVEEVLYRIRRSPIKFQGHPGRKIEDLNPISNLNMSTRPVAAIKSLRFALFFFSFYQLHQPRLWFITGGYLVKRWFIPAAARAKGQSNDLNREFLASNIFNCHKEVINAPPVPSISRCIHIVYRHQNVWEYQWSNFIYNCMSTFFTMFVAKMPSSTAAPLVVKGANH